MNDNNNKTQIPAKFILYDEAHVHATCKFRYTDHRNILNGTLILRYLTEHSETIRPLMFSAINIIKCIMTEHGFQVFVHNISYPIIITWETSESKCITTHVCNSPMYFESMEHLKWPVRCSPYFPSNTSSLLLVKQCSWYMVSMNTVIF